MGSANSAAGNEVDMCTQLFQWYLTLCDPVDCILTGSSVHGILQARILEWVAMPSSGDFPNQGIDPISCTTGRFFTYVAQLVKNPPAMWESWVRKIPWRRERLPTPVFWPGEFHGPYTPWGRKESETVERISLFLLKRCA